MNINTHDMGMTENPRELQLTVRREDVWEEVAKLTDYTGSNAIAVVALCIVMSVCLLSGCKSQHVSEPVVVTETHDSFISDSLVCMMRSMLLHIQNMNQTESVSEVERIREVTVLNENKDTIRHDTHSDKTTTYTMRLERENMILQRENDSLRNMTSRVDSVAVPVPYKVEVPVPVEKDLSWWEKTRIKTWWWVTGALTGCILYIFRVPLIRFARRSLLKKFRS